MKKFVTMFAMLVFALCYGAMVSHLTAVQACAADGTEPGGGPDSDDDGDSF